MKKNKINFVKKFEKFKSWYEDANNILKGKWDLVNENYERTDGLKEYLIYYSKPNKYIPINECGFFYDTFDCRKYDGAVCIDLHDIPESNTDNPKNLFIIEKNNRFGLMDIYNHTILHVCYNSIRLMSLSSENIFLTTCDTGMFIYNFNRHCQSEVFEKIKYYNEEFLLFMQDGKYGLIDLKGNITLPANFMYNDLTSRWEDILYGEFKGHYYHIYIKNNLVNGKFHLNNGVSYMPFCVDNLGYSKVIITSKNGKFGIIWECEKYVVEECILDDIIMKPNKTKWNHCFERNSLYVEKKQRGVVFVIAIKDNKYRLYNAIEQRCLISDCDDMCQVETYKGWKKYRDGHDYIKFKKNNKVGYVTKCGIILDGNCYDDIQLINYKFHVKKNGKFGVLYESGEELLPCEYDKIIQKNDSEFVLLKNGVKELFCQKNTSKIMANNNYEPNHYSMYGGAHGFSDEEIDTIFDGDPDAYWNID